MVRRVQNSLTKVIQYSLLALEEIFLYKAMWESRNEKTGSCELALMIVDIT